MMASFKVGNSKNKLALVVILLASLFLFSQNKEASAKTINLGTSTDSIFVGGKMGIGISNPGTKLDIFEDYLKLSGTTAYSHGILMDRGPAITTTALQSSIFTEWNGLANAESLTSRAWAYKWQKTDGTNWMVINNAGNVGIGTTNPGARMEVFGDGVNDGLRVRGGTASNQINLKINDPGNTAVLSTRFNGLTIQGNEGGNAPSISIIPGTTGSFIVTAGGSERMRVNSLGNIGIGTTAPANKLAISGGTGDVLNVGGGQISGLNSTPINTDQAVPLGYLQNNYVPIGSGAGGIGAGTSGQTLRHNGTSWVANSVLFNDGTNIGIGTTTPGAKLDVNGQVSGSDPIADRNFVTRGWLNSAWGGRFYEYLFGGYYNAGAVEYIGTITISSNGSSGTFSFELASQSGINMTSGIIQVSSLAGVATPYLKLVSSDSIGGTILAKRRTDPTIIDFYYSAPNSIPYTPRFRVFNTSGYTNSAPVTPSTWDYTFNLDSLATKNLQATGNILVNGNMAVGGGSAFSKLSLRGGASGPSLVARTTSLFNIDRGDAGTDLVFTIDASAPFAASIQHRHQSVNGISYPIALNPLGGNVGIGTTTPSTKLTISGGTGNALYMNGGQISGLNSTPVNSDQAVPLGYLQANYSPSTATTLWSGTKNGNIWNGDSGAGNVGIGTTNPTQKLEVTGNALINPTGSAYLTVGKAFSFNGYNGMGGGMGSNVYYDGSNWRYMTSGPANLYWGGAGGEFGFYTISSGTAGNVATLNRKMVLSNVGGLSLGSNYVNTDPGSNNMIIEGNVGIGITAPGVKLTTRSGVNAFPATSGSTQSAGAFRVEGGDNAVIDMGANSVNTWIQATDKTSLSLNYKLLLNPNGGNVGVGTTNPLSRLDVNGDITLSGTSRIIRSSAFGTAIYDQQYNKYLLSQSWISGYNDFIFLGNGGSNTTNNWAALSSGYGFQVGTGATSTPGGTTHLTVNNAGNIGISTTTPSLKLVVNGGTGNVLNLAGGQISGLNSTPVNSDQAVPLGYLQNNYVPIGSGAGGIGSGTSGQTLRHNGTSWVANSNLFNDGTNVGIGTSTPGAKLDVNGNMKVGGVFLDMARMNNSFVLFDSQPYIEGGYWPFSGGPQAYDYVNDASVPFSKVALANNSASAYSDFIPVNPGDTLYGEIWAMRKSDATGVDGPLYYGIERYDKDKKPLTSNNGCTYFVAGAVSVPLDGVWKKYSAYTVLPTSHTPYNGSDGGPVRYVKIRLLFNWGSGTIPTYWGGVILRKVTATPNNDLGNVSFAGNVGIGTTNPRTKIDIIGPAGITSFTGTNKLGLAVAGGTNYTSGSQDYSGLDFYNSNISTSIARIGASAITGIGSYLQFGTTNNWSSGITNIAMTINPAGNIGVGTTSPYLKLVVNGGTGNVLNLAGGYINGLNSTPVNSDQAVPLGYLQNNYVPIGSGAGGIGSGTSGQTLRHNGTSWVANSTLFNDGTNVGVGTSNPTRLLSVGSISTSGSAMNILSSSGSFGFLAFGDSNDDNQAQILYDHASDNFSIQTGGGTTFGGGKDRLVIDNAGNVGIGITAPLNKLDVNGNIELSGNIYGKSTDFSYITIAQGSSYDQNFYTRGVGGVAYERLRIEGGADVDTIAMLNSNVGIGTTNPLNKLQIEGNIHVNGALAHILVGNQGADGDVHFGASGIGVPPNGNQDYGFYAAYNAYRGSDGNWYHSRPAGGSLQGAVRFTGSNTTASGINGFRWDTSANVGTSSIPWINLMTLTNAGNLGIATTTPALKLVVNGGTGNALNLAGGQINGLNSTPVNSDQAVPLGYLQANYSPSTATTLWSGTKNGSIWNGDSGVGNVGIGTTNPAYKLDINGSFNAAASSSSMTLDADGNILIGI